MGKSNQKTQTQIHRLDPTSQYWWMNVFRFFSENKTLKFLFKRSPCIKKLSNINEKLQVLIVSKNSFYCIYQMPFYINSENIYWEPSMCQALLSNWATSVKKPSKDPVELTFSTDRNCTLWAYIATKTHGPFTKKGTGENVCWIGFVDNVLTSSSACLFVCLSCLSVCFRLWKQYAA